MRRLTIFLAVFLTRCEGIKSTLGLDHEGPNEFDAVPLSPLSLPQDFHKTPATEATLVDLTDRENELFPFVQETSKQEKDAGIRTVEPIQREAGHQEKKTEVLETTKELLKIQKTEPSEKGDQASGVLEVPEASPKVPSQEVSGKSSKLLESNMSARKDAKRTAPQPSPNPQEMTLKAVSLPIVSHPVVEEWEKMPAVGATVSANQVDVLNNSWATVSSSLRLQEPELLVVSDEVIPVKEPPVDPRYDRLAEERRASSKGKKTEARKKKRSSSPNDKQAESVSESQAVVAASSRPSACEQRLALVARPQEKGIAEAQQGGEETVSLPPLMERRDMQPILGRRGNSLKKRGVVRSPTPASRQARTLAVPQASTRQASSLKKAVVARGSAHKKHVRQEGIRTVDSVQARSQAFAQPAQSTSFSQAFTAPQAWSNSVSQPVISKSQKRVSYAGKTSKGAKKALSSKRSFGEHNASSKAGNRPAGVPQFVTASKTFSQPAQSSASGHSTQQTVRQPHASQGNTTMKPILSRPSKVFKKSKGSKKGVRRRYSVRSQLPHHRAP